MEANTYTQQKILEAIREVAKNKQKIKVISTKRVDEKAIKCYKVEAKYKDYNIAIYYDNVFDDGLVRLESNDIAIYKDSIENAIWIIDYKDKDYYIIKADEMEFKVDKNEFREIEELFKHFSN